MSSLNLILEFYSADEQSLILKLLPILQLIEGQSKLLL